MKKFILTFFLTFLYLSPVNAQSYFGDNIPTRGTCCNWVGQADASGLSACPADILATRPSCIVITQAQYNAAIHSNGQPIVQKSLTVSAGTPSINSCTNGSLAPGSTDGQGTIIMSGASITTSCSVNFGSPPYNGPGCQPAAAGPSAPGIITTTTGFTFNLAAVFPNGRLAYTCPQ